VRSTNCLQSSSMEWSENLLKAPSKALEAAELVPAAPGTLVGIYKQIGTSTIETVRLL
jgi:hypothetical protein